MARLYPFTQPKRQPEVMHYINRRQTASNRDPPGLHLEFDALRQRQGAAVVDRVGGTAHIRFPRIRAGFTTATSFFFAAKNTANFSPTGANVDVGNAAV